MVLKFLKRLSLLRRIASAFSAETRFKRALQTKNVQSEKTTMMKSTKPYLLRAMYQWMIDSDCTPLLLVRTDLLGVVIPEGYTQDDRIILDIATDSVQNFSMREHIISFEAMFGEKVCKVRVPMVAVLAIRASENGHGMDFEEEEVTGSEGNADSEKGVPNLRVL